MDVGARVEAFLADYEKLEWYEWINDYRYHNGWHPQKDKARELAKAHLAYMEKTYGVWTVRSLGESLLKLLDRKKMGDRQYDAPKLLNRLDKYASITLPVNRREATLKKHIHEMSQIVGSPDPNNYDIGGDWDELRTRLRRFVAGLPDWLETELAA